MTIDQEILIQGLWMLSQSPEPSLGLGKASQGSYGMDQDLEGAICQPHFGKGDVSQAGSSRVRMVKSTWGLKARRCGHRASLALQLSLSMVGGW